MTTTRLPDSADFYTAERAVREEVIWVLEAHHLKHLAFLQPHLETEGVKTVLEFGCGAGLLAAALGPPIEEYTGIDKNSFFISKAALRPMAKISRRSLQCWDVRNFGGINAYPYDLSMAWNFFKHFHLDEWEGMVNNLLCWGRFGAFNMQVMEADREDGRDFPHTFVTRRRLEEAVKAAGHEIVEVAIHNRWALQDVGMAEDMVVWTRRISTEGDFVKPDGSIGKMYAVDFPPGCDKITEEELLKLPLMEVSITNPGERIMQRLPVERPLPDWAKQKSADQWLEIDGQRATPFTDYSLRWTDDETPVLYHKGKRVTRAWRLQLDVAQPEDVEGKNANTE